VNPLNYIVASLAVVAVFPYCVRLRELSLLRTKLDFLLLHLSGAAYLGWVAIQAAVFGVLDVSHLAGIVFSVCYISMSSAKWEAGPPQYTFRESLVDAQDTVHAE
jgi:hypothetical protein